MGVRLLQSLEETTVPEPGWATPLSNVAISWIAYSHIPFLEDEYQVHRAAAGGGHSKSAHKLVCRGSCQRRVIFRLGELPCTVPFLILFWKTVGSGHITMSHSWWPLRVGRLCRRWHQSHPSQAPVNVSTLTSPRGYEKKSNGVCFDGGNATLDLCL